MATLQTIAVTVLALGVAGYALYSVSNQSAKPGDDDTKPDDTPPDQGGESKPPDPAAQAKAEADACALTVSDKPAVYMGRTPAAMGIPVGPGGELQTNATWAAWLALVAYWRANPNASPVATTADELLSLGRVRSCVVPQVNPPPKNPPVIDDLTLLADPVVLAALAYWAAIDNRPDAKERMATAYDALVAAKLWPAKFQGYANASDEVKLKTWKQANVLKELPTPNAATQAAAQDLYQRLYKLPPLKGVLIAVDPTPGAYYQIKAGDNLFTVAAKAYGTTPETPENLAAAQHINSHDYNHRFWYAQDPLFPPGNVRIAFLPQYGTFQQQFADAAHGAHNLGTSYEVIYIPE